MSSLFDKLVSKELITGHPKFIKNNIHYEAMVGSVSYGVSQDSSDIDVYGFCMPPKHILFPFASEKIFGFGDPPEVFNQFQKHHIKDHSCDKEYDISMYNIVRYFQLCMESNPNMVDSLFVPQRCVLFTSQLGQMVRDNRKLFLSKLAWHKFRGYAFSQLSKMNDKVSKEFVDLCNKHEWPLDIRYEDVCEQTHDVGIKRVFAKIDQSGHRTKRLATIKEFGYDVKFAYNVVRLCQECQQILEEGDLDLTRDREMLKSIRRGEWPQEKIQEFFDMKVPILEEAYKNSELPYSPREQEIKKLLVECIQMHYGSEVVDSVFSLSTPVTEELWKLKKIVDNLLKTL